MWKFNIENLSLRISTDLFNRCIVSFLRLLYYWLQGYLHDTLVSTENAKGWKCIFKWLRETRGEKVTKFWKFIARRRWKIAWRFEKVRNLSNLENTQTKKTTGQSTNISSLLIFFSLIPLETIYNNWSITIELKKKMCN